MELTKATPLSKPEMVNTTTRIKRPIVTRLDAYAIEHGLSRNSAINMLLAEMLTIKENQN